MGILSVLFLPGIGQSHPTTLSHCQPLLFQGKVVLPLLPSQGEGAGIHLNPTPALPVAVLSNTAFALCRDSASSDPSPSLQELKGS